MIFCISKIKQFYLRVYLLFVKKEKDKCPPWSLKAKKIKHDKIKKTIYYEHATLKVYDIPIFYFPKIFSSRPNCKKTIWFLGSIFYK